MSITFDRPLNLPQELREDFDVLDERKSTIENIFAQMINTHTGEVMDTTSLATVSTILEKLVAIIERVQDAVLTIIGPDDMRDTPEYSSLRRKYVKELLDWIESVKIQLNEFKLRSADYIRAPINTSNLAAEFEKLKAIPDEEDKKVFEQKVINSQFKKENIIRDGNCFLRCVVRALQYSELRENFDEDKHAKAGRLKKELGEATQLRMKLANYMSKNAEEYRESCQQSSRHGNAVNISYEEYISELKNPGRYLERKDSNPQILEEATYLVREDIQALVNMCKIEVRVFQSGQIQANSENEIIPSETFTGKDHNPSCPIVNVYLDAKSSHYNLLIPRPKHSVRNPSSRSR